MVAYILFLALLHISRVYLYVLYIIIMTLATSSTVDIAQGTHILRPPTMDVSRHLESIYARHLSKNFAIRLLYTSAR